MPIRSNQPWHPESFRSEIMGMPASDLFELQFTGLGYERVPERMTWRVYMENMTARHGGGTPVTMPDLVNRCVQANVSPHDIAQMARNELLSRAEAAEDEMESAADHVNWTRTPVEGFSWMYDFPMLQVRSLPGFEKMRRDNWDVLWAYIFGEPLYVTVRVGNVEHAVTPWEPKPNRVPRRSVEQVFFATMVPTDEPDENDLWALMRLVNGRVMTIHHQDAMGLTSFRQYRTITSALERMPVRVREVLGDLRYMALSFL